MVMEITLNELSLRPISTVCPNICDHADTFVTLSMLTDVASYLNQDGGHNFRFDGRHVEFR